MAYAAEERGVGAEIPHPPVFSEKRLQAIENKGWGSEKEGQEISRGAKLLRD